jgi:MarR family transcriptional regulator, organic hydroperoxide resistance regulator
MIFASLHLLEEIHVGQKDQIAKEISELLPTFIRHMYPYVFAPIHVPPSQVLAMVSIQERGGCTLTELRKEMHVSAPTITGIIDRLERDGYVKRSTDKTDRRIKNVILTKKGLRIIDQFRRNIMKRWQHILSKMPLEMAQTQVNIMHKITRGFIDGAI